MNYKVLKPKPWIYNYDGDLLSNLLGFKFRSNNNGDDDEFTEKQ